MPSLPVCAPTSRPVTGDGALSGDQPKLDLSAPFKPLANEFQSEGPRLPECLGPAWAADNPDLAPLPSSCCPKPRSSEWSAQNGDDAAADRQHAAFDSSAHVQVSETAPPDEAPDSKLGEGENDEEDKVEVNERRERAKCAAAIVGVFATWAAIFCGLHAGRSGFEGPDCTAVPFNVRMQKRSCDVCGKGTLILPIFGEFEQSWSRGARSVLYAAGVLCIFMGMGIVCDQFMAAIEEITSSERVIWREVHDGAKRKFRVKVWSATVANLTLMALGSSAPEIMLSATELIGNRFFSGSLGPLTIVGSASFNLFMITAVCVSAIPAPEVRKIENMDAFKVTATSAVLAYLWVLVVLVGISPHKVQIWEAVVTLACFPCLTVLAFAADKGWLRRLCFQAELEVDEHLQVEQARASVQFGKILPRETLKLLYASNNDHKFSHRSEFRKRATGMMTGGRKKQLQTDSTTSSENSAAAPSGKIIFGFAEERVVVLECCGSVQIRVTASRPPSGCVQLRYFTREGSAKAGLRYTSVEGFLSFGPGVVQRSIEVPIIDDEIWEPEEEFFVELCDLQVVPGMAQSLNSKGFGSEGSGSQRSPPYCSELELEVPISVSEGKVWKSSASPKSAPPDEYLLGARLATVTVLNDDDPGTLAFDADEVLTTAGAVATLGVVRTLGWCGAICCVFETVDDSATAGKDYTAIKGVLSFENEEKHKKIEIPIMPSGDRPKERFKVILKDPSPGVLFDTNTDGGETSAICDIIIEAKGEASLATRVVRMFINSDRWEVARELWLDQCVELLYCGGSPEEQAEAGIISWMAHLMALLWKVLFLCVPPPLLGGGWPCFIVALAFIGLVTAMAGDVSSLLGCVLGIPDDVTAITLVALGTSLPDTFASRTAALHDDTADNAVGNVTGSNSVNVFLGCGLSWIIGAVYWERQGVTPEWMAYNHNGVSFEELYFHDNPEGGLMVNTNTLVVSVTVYACCAAVCLGTLAWRRHQYGGELGGPRSAQLRSSGFLACLWFVFIIVTVITSVLTSLG